MPRFTTQLIGRTEVAEGTPAFWFERPEDFDFTAGQHLTVTLPNPLYQDEKGNRRTFSIASPPQEAKALLIATRMTGSALKRSLAEMPLGAPVEVFGPAGIFTLHPDPSVPAVFVAGGIGITPFRSMLLDALDRDPSRSITLIYSNRAPGGAAFHEELARLAEAHPSFVYVPTMTQAEAVQPPWIGERRLVDADFLHDHLVEIKASIFYVAGPPGLVAAASQAVLEAGANPAHLRSEEFGGYGTAPTVVVAEKAPVAAGFVKIGEVSDLAPGQVKAVEVGGSRIALCNVGGVYYAIDDTCSHRGASLAEGELIGQQITCPEHGAVFDVTTGAVLEPPASEAQACYRVRLNGNAIEIEI